jgi:hypothetical protein
LAAEQHPASAPTATLGDGGGGLWLGFGLGRCVTCEGWENESRCFIGFFFFFAKTVTDSDLNDKKIKRIS